MLRNSPLLIHISDDQLGFMGYLAIDSFVRDRAFGGIRVKVGNNTPHSDYEIEVMALAREMTLKFGFHEIPLGGAKLIIILPPSQSRQQRDHYFEVFGRHLGPLLRKGVLNTGQDMGMSERDLYFFVQGTGLGKAQGIPSEHVKSDSGKFTAIGILQTFKNFCHHRQWDLRQLGCAIEGFGSVGSQLAECLNSENVRVIGISTLKGALYNKEGLDVQELSRLQLQHGDRLVEYYPNAQKLAKEELFMVETDVLFPCGGLFSIHDGNAAKIQAKAVITGANCSAKEDIIAKIEERNKFFIPGFVANAGSVLKSHLVKARGPKTNEELVLQVKDLFDQRMESLFSEAQSNGRSLYAQAKAIALANQNRLNKQKDNLTKKVGRKFLSLIKVGRSCVY